ncbi:hypothetical protein WH47_12039 [Habropoda laboriosa]|uniref:Uncharacterized protein n=1 Tax=Habropoda laboriosa TaxID=597456 RepID=A0A0L7R141_9HYME|nr:hypothetical protein WH47_12039 [Habropoda laboriosa]
MASMHIDYPNYTIKFDFIIEKLLILTKKRYNETNLINNYLCELNDLDYRYVTISNNDVIQLLIKQLCTIIIPAETTLVQNHCKLLTNLIQNNVKFEEETFTFSKRWIIKVFKFASPLVHNNVILSLKSILMNEQFDDMNHVSINIF